MQAIAELRGGRDLAAALLASPRDEEVVVSLIGQMRARGDMPALVLHAICMSAEDIIDKWNRNKEECANAGTYMHWRFEAWLNSVPVNEDGDEFQMFLRFVRQLHGLTAFRAEWMIYAEEEKCRGAH